MLFPMGPDLRSKIINRAFKEMWGVRRVIRTRDRQWLTLSGSCIKSSSI